MPILNPSLSTELVATTDLQPPSLLIDSCVGGECVLYAGAGLGARAGFATFRPFLAEMVRWARTKKYLSVQTAESYQASIDHGYVNSVADGLVEELKAHMSSVHAYLKEAFGREVPLSDAHNLLKQIDFAAVLTSNLDKLLEKTYSAPSSRLFTPRDARPLIEMLQKRVFFVLKLYGDIERPDSVIISPVQLEDAIRENLPFLQFMQTLFFTRTILFIGASFEGIEDYLKGIGLRKQEGAKPHFALIGVRGEGWQPRAASLERRYGITILPYVLDHDYTEVPKFLNHLVEAVRQRQLGHATKRHSVAALKRIHIDNIGPFESLDLSLNPTWNILLGDNGVGKSVIVRAIAAAICGKDAQPFVGRLIQAGKTSAAIVLETDRNVYKTELLATTTGAADLRSIPVRPLEAENWLALGFPALRTVSWERPNVPQNIDKALPCPDDLIPLVAAVPDPRLDKLKQWLVNLDYLNKHEQSIGGPGGRSEKLLNEFFDIMGKLSEGLTIRRGEVNPLTREITVMTDDGALPLEAVSQGTTSLIGWVGVLLQRLYEIYSDDEDPKMRYALVLMDEIDAHLHPSWQQSLVFNLSKVFPNVQFIATTHSPLIIGGMPPEQIFRFARDENGKATRVQVDPDMTVGRTDQILTTPLFGLKTTLDRATQEGIKRYQELIGKIRRSHEEEKEFQKLRKSFNFEFPQPLDHWAKDVPILKHVKILCVMQKKNCLRPNLYGLQNQEN